MKAALLKIAIIGPESTGKSTLSQALAWHYKTKWSREYARKYLENLNRDYIQEDLIEIAKGQIANEEKAIQNARKYVFFDTNLEVIKVWSQYKYGNVPDPIYHWHKAREYHAYILTNIDLPWEDDPLREHPDPKQRKELFAIYLNIVKKSGLPYHIVSGNEKDRLESAIKFLNKEFGENY
ncbi:MAG TPA: ATP-binding protein [Chitinophagaceae bacterium]|nr:ATP-binding protein [Chitinophagaceae bacterium]